ncbi:MAG: polymerase sigma factor FliA [Miltoncostaeaceae bacterium]|jgi:RNA polymerase sigma factor for flagellar operon FliA|nr:polymerase sigma factor FliA [Miltoncostaeaceae bacterium]
MLPSAQDVKRLTHRQAEDAWRAWSERRDAAARDRLVLAYAPMVRYLATKKVRDLPAHCELDDLISCGLIALIEAVERFDPTRGASFEQYAWTRASGAIVDELRRQDWASRSVRKAGRQIERAREKWYGDQGRAPSEEELAGVLKIDVGQIRTALEELSRADLMSLSAPAGGGEESVTIELGETVRAGIGDHEPEHAVLRSERHRALRAGIRALSPRERQVLTMVHVQELPGAEIGRRLGISESRVSQILSGVRKKLKDALGAYDRPEKVAA